MIQKQYHRRSDAEWIALIQECRSSGKSDLAWCLEHGIPSSTFYNRIALLRKKACQIPSSVPAQTQPDQQVVPLMIMEETPALTGSETEQIHALTPAVILHFNNCRLEINNHANKETIHNTLLALGKLC